MNTFDTYNELTLRHPLRQRIKLPAKLMLRGGSMEIAEYFAKLYKKAKTDAEKYKVVESLLVIAAQYDIITRSICYLNIFEDRTGEKFSFWK